MKKSEKLHALAGVFSLVALIALVYTLVALNREGTLVFVASGALAVAFGLFGDRAKAEEVGPVERAAEKPLPLTEDVHANPYVERPKILVVAQGFERAGQIVFDRGLNPLSERVKVISSPGDLQGLAWEEAYVCRNAPPEVIEALRVSHAQQPSATWTWVY